jgi:hypothetical protein
LNYELIISGDLNEVLGDDPAEFGAITSEFNLADVYRHRHGMIEPATYNRGHRRLDYILCSSPLLSAVTACGILPFDVLSRSDHRTVFVDFDTKLLFGSLPSELVHTKTPTFHSRDYETTEAYVNSVHAFCNEKQVYQMAEEALESATPAALNRLYTLSAKPWTQVSKPSSNDTARRCDRLGCSEPTNSRPAVGKPVPWQE